MWNVVKSVVVVVVVLLMLSVFLVEVKEDNVFLSFLDNEVGEVVSLLYILIVCFVVGGRGIVGIGCVMLYCLEGMLLCVYECVV